jgi:peptidoglycan/LPS O-acetylase OafA/YrhL
MKDPGVRLGPMRNRYIDLLRGVAIARVVVYHTSGWTMLSFLPAMSVMFALGGSLMASSLDRSGVRAVGRRLRRLLPSLWLLSAVFVPAMWLTGLDAHWKLLLWVVPLADPPANHWGALALSTIWYLRDYLWFVLVSPLALWLFRRAPVPMLIAPYLLLLVFELGLLSGPPTLRDFGLYFGAWMLGFAHHDGLLRRWSRKVLAVAAAVFCATGLAWILTHPGFRGYDLNDIPLGNALWSAGLILVALGFMPARADWITRWGWFDRVITVLNSRALTIYLWHMPIVILVAWAASPLGYEGLQVDRVAVRLAFVVLLVTAAVAAFGWVEDLAARRSPTLLPGARRRPPLPIPVSPAPALVPAPVDRPTLLWRWDRAGAPAQLEEHRHHAVVSRWTNGAPGPRI